MGFYRVFERLLGAKGLSGVFIRLSKGLLSTCTEHVGIFKGLLKGLQGVFERFLKGLSGAFKGF